MRTVGSRELKAKLSEVLRVVRENDEVVVVTHRGRPVARIVPEPRGGSAKRFDEVWSEMDQIAAAIARDWPEGVSAAGAVAEDRRAVGNG